jgi:hypothetical protein
MREIDDLIYQPDFMSQRDATELYDYIRNNLPFVRPRNKLSGNKYAIRRLTYPGYCPNPDIYRKAGSQRENHGGTVIDAPPLYGDLSSRASAFGDANFNYASTIAYNADDYMRGHQHDEDRKRVDQRVIVLSLGAVHPVRIYFGATVKFVDPATGKLAEKFVPNGMTQEILPSHGSIYLLPTRFNQIGSLGEAQHAVLPGDDGLRISINMKAIPDGLNDEDFCEACSRPAGRANAHSSELFVREPGPPRIYDCHVGKRWPEAAVYVGREVLDRRTGKVDWPSTPYGNHHKLNGQAWIDETNRLMADEEFATKMRNDLRGRDLLCWCKPNEPNCHAKIWLKLANE